MKNIILTLIITLPLTLLGQGFNCVELEDGIKACEAVYDEIGEFSSIFDCIQSCSDGVGSLFFSCEPGVCACGPIFAGYSQLNFWSVDDCENYTGNCCNVSYNCENNSCVELYNLDGSYSSIEECEAVCGQFSPTFNCIDGSCIEVNDGTGLFSSLEGCQEFCNSTSLTDFNNSNKKLKKISNLLGQEIPIRKNSQMLYIYDDGSVEKRIVIE